MNWKKYGKGAVIAIDCLVIFFMIYVIAAGAGYTVLVGDDFTHGVRVGVFHVPFIQYFAASLQYMKEIYLDWQGTYFAMFIQYSAHLKNVKGITARQIQKDVQSNYAYYNIIVDETVYGHTRDELFDFLEKNGIHSRKYFYPAINDLDVYRASYDPKETPVAYSISRRVLTLPMYADLPLETVDRICDLVRELGKS